MCELNVTALLSLLLVYCSPWDCPSMIFCAISDLTCDWVIFSYVGGIPASSFQYQLGEHEYRFGEYQYGEYEWLLITGY